MGCRRCGGLTYDVVFTDCCTHTQHAAAKCLICANITFEVLGCVTADRDLHREALHKWSDARMNSGTSFVKYRKYRLRPHHKKATLRRVAASLAKT